MQLSVAARKTRKEAQLARLAAKGTPRYAEMYASQPDQVRIAQEQSAARKAIRAAKSAEVDTATSDANAAIEVFSSITMQKGAK